MDASTAVVASTPADNDALRKIPEISLHVDRQSPDYDFPGPSEPTFGESF